VQGWLLGGLRTIVRHQGADRPAAYLAADAHVRRPTAGSVIPGRLLLKWGPTASIKLGFPLFPEAARAADQLGDAGGRFQHRLRRLMALVQTDIKKIIAYSSIQSPGLRDAGAGQPRPDRIHGAIIQMVSHGLTADRPVS